MMYTALVVWQHLVDGSSFHEVRDRLTRTSTRGLGLLDRPNFVTSISHRHENSTSSWPVQFVNFEKSIESSWRLTTQIDRSPNDLAGSSIVPNAEIISKESS